MSPQQMRTSRRTQQASVVRGTSPGRSATGRAQISSGRLQTCFGLMLRRRSSRWRHNELRSAFQANYPGELLDSNSTPGQRYWALVCGSLKPENRLAWTPWTQIINEKKHMELLEKKGHRPLSNIQLSTQMCWEDVPQIDEASLSAAPWPNLANPQQRLCALWRCHLASYKTFDAKLMACYTHHHATDRRLRSPNLSELMSAGRRLVEKILPARQRGESEPRRCAARTLFRSTRRGCGFATTPKAKLCRSTDERRTRTARADAPQRKEAKGRQERR